MGLFNRFKRSDGGEGGGDGSGPSAEGHSGSNAEDQDAEKKKKKLQSRRKSWFQFISPSDVTTESLQVWAGLPQKIRQDPSMASFQLECDRLHDEGLDIAVNNEETALDIALDPSNETAEADSQQNDQEEEEIEDEDRSEFITIKMTTPPSASSSPEEENENEISTHPLQDVVESHPNPATHSAPHTSHSAPTLNPNHSGSDLQHEDISILRDKHYQKYLKGVSLFALWLLFALILMMTNEKKRPHNSMSIGMNDTKYVVITDKPTNERSVVNAIGPFLADEFSEEKHPLYVAMQMEVYSTETQENIGDAGEVWQIPIVESEQFDLAKNLKRSHIFHFGSISDRVELANPEFKIRMKIWSNSDLDLPIKINVDSNPMNTDIGIILAAIILILLYVLIIWEIVHRTFAAILISTLSIAILAALDDRPTMKDIIQWIDAETILLLFSMMILVAILTETGVFDYLAVYTFKVTGGKIWPLVHGLGIVTLVISAFLDNVTTVLLMTPITIRLCEVMELNPVPILMSIIVHANIGGTSTPVGDPPNVIITSHPFIAKHGVSFLSFTLHMTMGVIFVAIQTNLMMRLMYRHINDLRLKEPKEIKDLRREIMVWKRASESISSYSKDADIVRETLLKKVKILQHKMRKLKVIGVPETTKYNATLEQLQKQYPIKNKPLLIKCCCILVFIIVLCIVQSFPEIQRLSVAWCALLGTLLLLIITFRDDMDALMHRIEWTTLLFFAAMFIIMEALERLGLINWIGKQTEHLILSVDESYRLAVAIILILWISGLSSSLVDSIPVTSMMVRVVVSLAQNSSLNLPLSPLVWAMAFGPCLGGNGTLVGASANVVCAGIAEQHGYKISFIEYFKFGFPMMLGSIIVTTGYLIAAHVLFTWH